MLGFVLDCIFIFGFLLILAPSSKTPRQDRLKKDAEAFHLFCRQVHTRIRKAENLSTLESLFEEDLKQLRRKRHGIERKQWSYAVNELWAFFLNKCSELSK
jgi:hypothetical protein